jgi:hypothetical protein
LFSIADVNGHDLQVIYGAEQALKNNMIKVLIFEHSHNHIWLETWLGEAVGYLNTLGLTCYWEGTDSLLRLTGCFESKYNIGEDHGVGVTTNVVCVSRKAAPGLIQLFDTHTIAHALGAFGGSTY